MRVLHLFSDWKWTGPAEPVVSLCETLNGQGLTVTLAYRKTPIEFPERTVEKEVIKRNVPGFDGLRLNRYFSPRDWMFDLKKIRSFVDERGVDIVHTHLSHDHATAAASLLFSKKRPLLVRTDHKRDGLPQSLPMACLMARTDGLVTYSEKLRQQDVAYFKLPLERSCKIPPGLKPYRGPVQDIKERLGLNDSDRVIGVIGRLKKDRGYDLILKAFRKVRDRMEHVKLVVVGRSSQIEESIKKPLVELGLEQDVILAGYRIEDYFSVIAAFDIFVMMRAGSDGTARALREVLGMGKPAIVSTHGMLPEIVIDGQTGYAVGLDADELADRMERLLSDEKMRAQFGAKARDYALTEWDYNRQAARLIDFYKRLTELGRRR
ncbi:MAG TPA: glycosyltransferase family 4 protein [Syntrophorhabdales bacterium]|nr:glycosyltransferase family 4 protein [Syntrophorhabdales bacterium]